MNRVVGAISGCILATLVILVTLGPLIAPFSPTETFGIPFSGPSAGHMLGLDVLGRDVVSRLFYGGASVLVQSVLVTFIAYVIAVPLGVLAGYMDGFVDAALSWASDIVLAFPPILLLLLLVAIYGNGVGVVLVAVVIGHIPPILKIVRSAVFGVAKSQFIESAKLRGESLPAIVRREILPSIAPTLVADIGTRLALSTLVIAGAGYLGIGQPPPASDWGLMVSENQSGLALQPLAVFAPAFLIALFIVCVNLVGDSFLASRGYRSSALYRMFFARKSQNTVEVQS